MVMDEWGVEYGVVENPGSICHGLNREIGTPLVVRSGVCISDSLVYDPWLCHYRWVRLQLNIHKRIIGLRLRLSVLTLSVYDPWLCHCRQVRLRLSAP